MTNPMKVLTIALVLAVVGCGSSGGPPEEGSGGAGGSPGTGGDASGTGGGASGGASASGGSVATGGSTGMGGATSGGSGSGGGLSATGGSPTSSGGEVGTGGTPSETGGTAGAAPEGSGGSSIGGAPGTGGMDSGGGPGGGAGGGTPAGTGGATGAGGGAPMCVASAGMVCGTCHGTTRCDGTCSIPEPAGQTTFLDKTINVPAGGSASTMTLGGPCSLGNQRQTDAVIVGPPDTAYPKRGACTVNWADTDANSCKVILTLMPGTTTKATCQVLITQKGVCPS